MRIAALSDQHGFLPDVAPCDLVLVAGDVCPDRIGASWAMQAPDLQADWFHRNARAWLSRVPAVHQVLTWGNHDWCGQACDFSQDAPGTARTGSVQIVVDRSTRVTLGDGSSARAESLLVWATPWSNQFMHWAFMKSPRALSTIYDAIPEGTDVIVSHQPPYGHGDTSFDALSGRVEHLGSHELLAAIDRVKPRLVICGHIHEGFGRYDRHGIPIYNVAIVDEGYRLVRAATIIDLPSP
jgi:3',5'-cyclic AMP phosphodiesterase CpdA